MKLALSQIISGVLVLAVAVLNTTHEMANQTIKVPAGTDPGTFIIVERGMDPWYGYLSFYLLLLGLAVIGVGVAQFIKARKHPNEMQQGKIQSALPID